MAPEPARYRFGPLERRGLVAGWRGGQIASVAGALVVAIGVLHSRPSPARVAVALAAVAAGVALATWPVGGRTGEEWLPTVTRWEISAVAGVRRQRSDAPGAGHGLVAAPGRFRRSPHPAAGARPASRRGAFGGLEILGADSGTGPAGPQLGVVFDRRARTHTAVLAVRGHNFALVSPDEQRQRVGRWATVLASLAREHSPVHRVQWVASALPDDGQAVRRYLGERAVLAADEPARRSYAELLEGAGAGTCRHEVFVAVADVVGGPRGPGRPGGGGRERRRLRRAGPGGGRPAAPARRRRRDGGAHARPRHTRGTGAPHDRPGPRRRTPGGCGGAVLALAGGHRRRVGLRAHRRDLARHLLGGRVAPGRGRRPTSWGRCCWARSAGRSPW